MTDPELPVAVIALGNVLMSDDGFGAHVLMHLGANYHIPDDVELRDLGTPGPNLTEELVGTRAVIVIDAVKGKGEPGSLSLYDLQHLRARPAPARLSPHEPTLVEALGSAALLGPAPTHAVLIGIIPKRIEPGLELTEPVAAVVAKAVRAVADELASLGAGLQRRDTPLPLPRLGPVEPGS